MYQYGSLDKNNWGPRHFSIKIGKFDDVFLQKYIFTCAFGKAPCGIGNAVHSAHGIVVIVAVAAVFQLVYRIRLAVSVVGHRHILTFVFKTKIFLSIFRVSKCFIFTDVYPFLSRIDDRSQRCDFIVPRCSVTFWTHPEIIPMGPFFRRWIKSINQA